MNSIIRNIKTTVEYINSDIDKFNASLDRIILDATEKRNSEIIDKRRQNDDLSNL